MPRKYLTSHIPKRLTVALTLACALLVWGGHLFMLPSTDARQNRNVNGNTSIGNVNRPDIDTGLNANTADELEYSRRSRDRDKDSSTRDKRVDTSTGAAGKAIDLGTRANRPPTDAERARVRSDAGR